MNLTCLWFWKNKGEPALKRLRFHRELLELRIDACAKQHTSVASKNLEYWSEILNLENSISSQKQALAAVQHVVETVIPKVKQNISIMEAHDVSPQLTKVSDLERIMVSHLITVLTEFLKLSVTHGP